MSQSITALLDRWRSGDRAAESALVEAVYPMLRELAAGQLRREGPLTLQATELVHETYARLCEQREANWNNRDHFFAIAATVLRRVVLDHVRQRGAEKRGGRSVFVRIADLAEEQLPLIDDQVDWLALDRALVELEAYDKDVARIVELKFFAGLPTERIAEVCASSPATVARRWRFARAWLAQRLGDPSSTTGALA